MTYVPLTELPEYVRNVRAMLKLLPQKNAATVVYLKGDLGAGKTTFVQHLARELQIVENIQSPTYVLMKSYNVPPGRTQFGTKRRFLKLVHIDAYRLENPQEFAALRPTEFLKDPNTLVMIEWPERLGDLAPAPDAVVNFSAEGMGAAEREIEVH